MDVIILGMVALGIDLVESKTRTNATNTRRFASCRAKTTCRQALFGRGRQGQHAAVTRWIQHRQYRMIRLFCA